MIFEEKLLQRRSVRTRFARAGRGRGASRKTTVLWRGKASARTGLYVSRVWNAHRGSG